MKDIEQASPPEALLDPIHLCGETAPGVTCHSCHRSFPTFKELQVHAAMAHRASPSVENQHQEDHKRSLQYNDDSDEDSDLPWNGVVLQHDKIRVVADEAHLNTTNNPTPGIRVSGGIQDVSMDLFELDQSDPLLQEGATDETNTAKVSAGSPARRREESRNENEPIVTNARENGVVSASTIQAKALPASNTANDGQSTHPTAPPGDDTTGFSQWPAAPAASGEQVSEETISYTSDEDNDKKAAVAVRKPVRVLYAPPLPPPDSPAQPQLADNEDGMSMSDDDETESENATSFDTEWDTNYAAVKHYLQNNGPAFIQMYTFYQGRALGPWAEQQRRALHFGDRALCTTDEQRHKIDKLNEIGFAWRKPAGPPKAPQLAETFEDSLLALRRYAEETGSMWVPSKTIFEGHSLGSWISRKKTLLGKAKKDGRITATQREQIDAFNRYGFLWKKVPKLDAPREWWVLKVGEYMIEYGKVYIPENVQYNGFPLGAWAEMQRRLLCFGDKGALLTEKGKEWVDELNRMGFIWQRPVEGSAGPVDDAIEADEQCTATLSGGTTTDHSQHPVNAPDNRANHFAPTVSKEKHSERGAPKSLRTNVDRGNGETVVETTSSAPMNLTGSSALLSSLATQDLSSSDSSVGSDEEVSNGAASGGIIDIQEMRALEQKWLKKSDIEGNIRQAEEKSSFCHLDYLCCQAEDSEFMKAVDEDITAHEAGTESTPRNQDKTRREWPDPIERYDERRQMTVIEYWEPDTSAWELEIRQPINSLAVSQGPSDVVEVVSRSYDFLCFSYGEDLAKRRAFRTEFVWAFNQKHKTQLKYYLARLDEEGTSWRIHVHGDRSCFNTFESFLAEWGSEHNRKFKFEDNQVESADNDDVDERHDDAESALNDDSTKKKTKSSRKKDDYHHFKSKFQGTVSIEFKASVGTHNNTAISAMWKVHKDLFGDSCNAECQCVFRLPELASSVPSVILNKKERGQIRDKYASEKLKRGKFPVEFAGNFATKFLPELQKSYPEETPQEILNRLVKMWKIHRFSFDNGDGRCGNNCRCLQGWEEKFHCGDTEKWQPERKRPRAAEAGSVGPDGLGRIPKKRKKPFNATIGGDVPTPLLPPDKQSRAQKLIDRSVSDKQSLISASGPLANGVRARSSQDAAPASRSGQPTNGRQKKLGRKSTITSPPGLMDGRRANTVAHRAPTTERQSFIALGTQEFTTEYEVLFTTDKPMGCYFMNKILPGSQRTVCVVKSLMPAIPLDPRIQPGTRVTAVICNGRKFEIKGVEQLRQLYEDNKPGEDADKGNTLKLHCSNVDVERMAASLGNGAENGNEDWCANGAWRGQLHPGGWAGGAVERDGRKGRAPRITNNFFASSGHPNDVSISLVNEDWVVIDASKVAQSKLRAGSSGLKMPARGILLKSDKPRVAKGISKGVRLADTRNNQERLFNMNAPTTLFFVKRGSADEDQYARHSTDSPDKSWDIRMEKLRKSVESNEVAALVNLFNDETSNEFDPAMLQDARKYIKGKESVEDTLRHNILKLMIDGRRLGKTAASLDEWNKLEVVVDKIDYIEFGNVFPASTNFSLNLSWEDIEANKADFIGKCEFVYDGNDVVLNHEYGNFKQIDFNEKVTNQRSLKYTLTLNGKPAGTAKIMLNMINLSSFLDNEHQGQAFSVLVEVDPTSSLRSAQIHYRVRRASWFDIAMQRYDVRKNMRDNIRDVVENKLENGVMRKVGGSNLSPDAVRGEGLSMLQMAVMFEAKRAVENLLVLGANPAPGFESLRELNSAMEKMEQNCRQEAEKSLNRERARFKLHGFQEHHRKSRQRLREIQEVLEEAMRRLEADKKPKLPVLQVDWLHSRIPAKHRCGFFDQ